MKTKKYRILRIVNNNKEFKYIPQVKTFLGWKNITFIGDAYFINLDPYITTNKTDAFTAIKKHYGKLSRKVEIEETFNLTYL